MLYIQSCLFFLGVDRFVSNSQFDDIVSNIGFMARVIASDVKSVLDTITDILVHAHVWCVIDTAGVLSKAENVESWQELSFWLLVFIFTNICRDYLL